jgi:cytochrome c5
MSERRELHSLAQRRPDNEKQDTTERWHEFSGLLAPTAKPKREQDQSAYIEREQNMRRVLSAIAGMTFVTAVPAAAADGQAIYAANCAACHTALKPKLGDKIAWEPLIKQGEDALVAAVIRGKGTMPPRAGKPALSDGDIKAAVEYMESTVK